MIRRIQTVCTLAILTAAVATVPASATHEPGGIYKGTTDGGGSVEFTLSDNGSEVVGYEVTDLPGTTFGGAGPCTTGSAIGAPTEIVNESFKYANSDPVYANAHLFEGTFGAPGSATGTVQVSDGDDAGCVTPTYTWTAKIVANASDVCDRAKAKLKKAKKQLQEADSPEAKEKATKKVKRAKKDVALFCE